MQAHLTSNIAQNDACDEWYVVMGRCLSGLHCMESRAAVLHMATSRALHVCCAGPNAQTSFLDGVHNTSTTLSQS